jgi:hypothetical protein
MVMLHHYFLFPGLQERVQPLLKKSEMNSVICLLQMKGRFLGRTITKFGSLYLHVEIMFKSDNMCAIY